MQIVILGRGNMGRPLSRLFHAAGHDVAAFGSADDPTAAIRTAEIVILAMKYDQAIAFAEAPGMADALLGKIVIDITNPLSPDFMSLTLGHETSAGEAIAAALPGAHVVKAFNTIFASVLSDHADGVSAAVPVFVAGDEASAVDTVMQIVSEAGLQAIAAGPLSNARYLEPMTEMMIQLGYGLGHGDRIGFAVAKAA